MMDDGGTKHGWTDGRMEKVTYGTKAPPKNQQIIPASRA